MCVFVTTGLNGVTLVDILACKILPLLDFSMINYVIRR